MRRVLGALVLSCALVGVMSTPGARAATRPRAHVPGRSIASPPVLAYYYIWFDQSSWNRAKTDRPELGPYSSDDAAVMRRQIRWAKQAGIEGFLVSWKHTPTLDRRLTQLIDIAEQEHFGLGIVYQGLDFHRDPLPADRVAGDLDYFAATFAARKPFQIFARPLVVWSGTWKFSPEDIARVTAGRRGALSILASERNVAGYTRIAGSVDGDAYYWSSVNPDTFPGYVEKLADLGREVHSRGGLWIAPVAPGFDARKIGGTSVVARAGDRTLLREIDAGLATSPDALGIISWNEFSENSHIEPSVRYGWTALNAVGERLGHGPVGSTADHGTGSAVPLQPEARARPARTSGVAATARRASSPSGLWILAAFALFFVALVVVMARRAHRSPHLRVVALTDSGASALHPAPSQCSRDARSSVVARTSPESQLAASETEAGGSVKVRARRDRRRRTPWHRLILNELSARRRNRSG